MKSHKPNKKKADELFRDLIRKKYNLICQNCGSTYNPQCAHLISRRYFQTRWSPENAVILCQKCHMKYTHHPLEWDLWCEKRLGKEEWEALRIRALSYQKLDYKKITSDLKELLDN